MQQMNFQGWIMLVLIQRYAFVKLCSHVAY